MEKEKIASQNTNLYSPGRIPLQLKIGSEYWTSDYRPLKIRIKTRHLFRNTGQGKSDLTIKIPNIFLKTNSSGNQILYRIIL